MPLTPEVCELLIPTKDSVEWWTTTDKQGMNALHGMLFAKREVGDQLVRDTKVVMAVMKNESTRGGREQCKKIVKAVLTQHSKWGKATAFLQGVTDANSKRIVKDILEKALRDAS